LVIPAELRAASGLKPGSEVVLEAHEGEIRIRSVDEALIRVQAKYKRLAQGRNMVDEFLAERREEAARE
jgi:AbrB family looped-hinge helix DNA binding protein